MTYNLDKIGEEENLKGASALVEVAAMTRVGVLSVGADMTGWRATQMERDAQKLERRGKVARAQELKNAAQVYKNVEKSMTLQREKEQIRPLISTDDTGLVQGRASKEGFGKAGMTVSLVAADGTILDRTKTTANGAFLLKQQPDVLGTRIVVADVDGTELGQLTSPKVGSKGSVFMDVPVERLDVMPVQPAPSDLRTDAMTMPDFTGAPLDDVAENLRSNFVLGEVKLSPARTKVGMILAQSPKPGAKAKSGGPVDLEIGIGGKAKDFATARALIRLDAEVLKTGLTDEMISAAEKTSKINTLEALSKLPLMDVEQVTALVPTKDKTQAAAWMAATKRVIALFSGN